MRNTFKTWSRYVVESPESTWNFILEEFIGHIVGVSNSIYVSDRRIGSETVSFGRPFRIAKVSLFQVFESELRWKRCIRNRMEVFFSLDEVIIC